MPCRTIRGDDGRVSAIVCSKRQPARPCVFCGAPSTLLCDFPVSKNGTLTCDRPLCRAHATRVGPDRDYCDPQQNRRHPKTIAARPGGARGQAV